jgi:uncharacterized protein (TIGR03067 family)
MTRFAAFALLTALTALASGCKNKPDAATDDKSRLQGEWVIEKVEGLPESDGPNDSELKKAIVTVKDNLITLTVGGKADRHATFAIDPGKSPKWADLTETNEKGEPILKLEGGTGATKDTPSGRIRAIYQIDGDRLVVAAGPPDAPRPTEFKDVAPKKDVSEKESGGVLVVHLKRK